MKVLNYTRGAICNKTTVYCFQLPLFSTEPQLGQLDICNAWLVLSVIEGWYLASRRKAYTPWHNVVLYMSIKAAVSGWGNAVHGMTRDPCVTLA